MHFPVQLETLTLPLSPGPQRYPTVTETDNPRVVQPLPPQLIEVSNAHQTDHDGVYAVVGVVDGRLPWAGAWRRDSRARRSVSRG